MNAAAVPQLSAQASSPPPDSTPTDPTSTQRQPLRAGPLADQHAVTHSSTMLQQQQQASAVSAQQHALRQAGSASELEQQQDHAGRQASAISAQQQQQQEHVVRQGSAVSAQQHAIQQANLARQRSGVALGRVPAQHRASESLPHPQPASTNSSESSEAENRVVSKQTSRMPPAPVLRRVQSKADT